MTEFDLATLTLRIGSPRLFYAFNKASMLPSAHTIYRKLKKVQKKKLDISYQTIFISFEMNIILCCQILVGDTLFF